MSMKNDDFFLASLVDDLSPVRPLNARQGLLWPLAVAFVAIIAIMSLIGARADLIAGTPHPMFLLRSGILLLLGVVSAGAAASLASPSVGNVPSAWKMALAAACTFPISALVVSLTGGAIGLTERISDGLSCLSWSICVAAMISVPLVLFLRSGAPVQTNRAGLLVGLSGGALGAFTFNFHCPYNDIAYIGLWYSLAVGACAVVGRLVVPHLIKW